MRQGLFAIVLIFAAFFGGALVNGPGLEWGRQQLASLSKHLPKQLPETIESAHGTASEEKTATTSLLDDSKDHTQPASARSFLPVAESSPFAPSSLMTEETSDREFTPAENSGGEIAPTVKAPLGPTIVPQSSPLDAASPDPSTTSTKDLPVPPPSLLDLARRKLSDRGVTQSGDQESRIGNTTRSPIDSSDPIASAPHAETLRSEASSDSEPSSGSFLTKTDNPFPGQDRSEPLSADPSIRLASHSNDPEEMSDWAEIRHRMEELEVGRYWVEGEFGGPVIFRCVVPMIGDRAVSQHFEGEGTDLIAAARITLRRIALWRATEETP
ncbi:hypothetical protein [Tautonia rosea]|uniref:hypothetical protein n=1 Tax=Tautonia rosea TaxID=2728037 RepID=UPI001474EA4A|nr:hypothetical protein [Tautonia rosea]